MVSKAKSCKGGPSMVEYIQNDKKLGDAKELSRNGIIGQEPKEIWEEFQMVSDANKRAENKTISIVISPSDEKKFNVVELREIGEKHLEKLGLKNNQYLMTLHQSTGKPHIHIVANRIDTNGKALNDSFISKKSQTISEEIAKGYGLLTAKEVKKIREIEIKPIKDEIKQAHNFAKNQSKNFGEYKEMMRVKGIEVIDGINKKGELQGFKFNHKSSQMIFKASEIGKKFGAKDLIMKGVKMPKLSPPLAKISEEVVYRVTQIKSRGISR